ncbi:TetR/AcrR family transcriptional regulator [Anaerolineae bacterium CFX9]|nr:TetR/AcrR family transcriptional regulator [Anaerolineae bacterium CFX9]
MQQARPILTPEERRQRNHDEMSAAILQAARDVMRTNGAADLNLQEIARRVGMRAPSLYTYFPSKAAIYEALFEMGMRMYGDQMEALHAQYGATWAGIEQAMENYLNFAIENPELYQLLFERPVPGFVPSPEGMLQANRLIDIARNIVREAIEAGMLRADIPADKYMNIFIAISHGLTAQHMANEPHLPAGSGRFGSLIPDMIALIRQVWSPPQAE